MSKTTLAAVIRGSDLEVTLVPAAGHGAEGFSVALEIGRVSPHATPVTLTCELAPGADGALVGRVPVIGHLADATGISWNVQQNGASLPADSIDAAQWQVGILRIPDRATYNRVMRYIYQRIDDAETLMWVTHVTAHADEIELRIRMTCFVVHCYRAIELGRLDLLEATLPVFADFAQHFDELAARYTTGTVREVGEQVALSVLSVQWHVLIRLGRHDQAVATLWTILKRGRNNTQYHTLPFAINYHNAGLLLQYLYFRRGISDGAETPMRDVYAQYRGITAGLSDAIPAYNHIKELEVSTGKLALATDLEWLMRPNVRASIADGTADAGTVRRLRFAEKSYDTARLFRTCSRQPDSDGLREAFDQFCEEADPRA